MDAFCRGRERIRTAVEGFADLCLATRPLDQSELECKCSYYLFLCNKGTIYFESIPVNQPQ